MAGREVPTHAHMLKRSGEACAARSPQLPAKTGRCRGAAAQLASVHSTLRHGPLLELHTGHAAASTQWMAARQAAAVIRDAFPDRMETDAKTRSEVSRDGVKVDCDSSRLAEPDAASKMQVYDIHLVSGQKRHLPHEELRDVHPDQELGHDTSQMNVAAVDDQLLVQRKADLCGVRSKSTLNGIGFVQHPSGPVRLDVVQRLIAARHNPKVDDRVIRHPNPEQKWAVLQIRDGSTQVTDGNLKKWIGQDDLDWSLEKDAVEGKRLYEDKKAINTERWAILQYTQAENLWINAKLRDPSRKLDQQALTFLTKAKDNWDIPSFEALIQVISSGLHRLPVPNLPAAALPGAVANLVGSNPVVSKGVNLTAHGNIAPRYTLDDHQVNRTFTVRELNSTSYGTPFLDRDSLIFYKLPRDHSGKNISDLSSKSNEREVLFPPGLTYRTLARFDRGTDEFDAILNHFGAAEKREIQHVIVVEVLSEKEPRESQQPTAPRPTPLGFGSSEPRFKPQFVTKTGLHGYL